MTHTHKLIRKEFKAHQQEFKHVGCSLCECYPVEVMEDVSRVSRSEAGWWDADDSHVVGNLHLLLHPWKVVWLALSSSSGWHVAELHCTVIQPLEDTCQSESKTNHPWCKKRQIQAGEKPLWWTNTDDQRRKCCVFRYQEVVINKCKVQLCDIYLILKSPNVATLPT